jgi:glycosyltransferase involved in cell wall biosynthesis
LVAAVAFAPSVAYQGAGARFGWVRSVGGDLACAASVLGASCVTSEKESQHRVKIGIDATVVAQSRIDGSSRFISQLVPQLIEVDPENEYYLCYRARVLKRPHRIWWPRHARLHIRVFQDPYSRRLFRKLDVFHATYQRLPVYEDTVPYVCTLHDIFFLSRADMVSAKGHERWSARYQDVALRSRLITTGSEFSKGEIVRLLGVPPQRVRVVPYAASAAFKPQPPSVVAEVRRHYGLAGPYILFGGGFDGRKNVLGGLQAFALALPRLPNDVLLAISGSDGPLAPGARTFVRESGLGGRVRFLGFVPECDYPGMICGSTLYFFPSLFEGFGLPALEAMACGAPVVTASTTSLPEVCGDAAVLVPPSNPTEMADALVRVATSPSLREDLCARGLRRARQSTWRHVAERMLEVYREAAG